MSTPDREPVEVIARAICAEQCAVYGEPPCYEHGWPNPDCDEPGCIALATAAHAAIRALPLSDAPASPTPPAKDD